MSTILTMQPWRFLSFPAPLPATGNSGRLEIGAHQVVPGFFSVISPSEVGKKARRIVDQEYPGLPKLLDRGFDEIGAGSRLVLKDRPWINATESGAQRIQRMLQLARFPQPIT